MDTHGHHSRNCSCNM